MHAAADNESKSHDLLTAKNIAVSKRVFMNIIDNSFLMLIKFLKSIDVNTIYCAGFDGYSDKEDNYCNPDMEYFFVKQAASHLNTHMKEAIAEFRKSIDIQFITYSSYDEVEDINGASI